MFRSAVSLVRPLAIGVLLVAGGAGCGGAGARSPDGASAGDGGVPADGGGADVPVIGGGPGTGGAGGQGIGGAGTGGIGTGGAGAGGAGTGGAGMGGAGGAGSVHPPLTGTITSTQTFADLGEVTTTSAQVAFVFAGNDSYDLYQVGSGTVSVHRDIVGNDCQAHLTFTGALGASDGSIILTPTGQYVASTSTVGTLTGTSACGTAAPEATTIPDQGMQWWPFPTTALLAVQPDGGLHDSFTETNADTGEMIQAQWLLVPTN